MIYLSCDNMKKIIFVISIFFICLNFVNAKETVKYAGCIDGDTIKVYLNDKKETVRLLAVDTPETGKPDKAADYYAKEASEYTCNKIKKAQKIILEYDTNSNKRDKYDRVLAWVFLDGNLLQSDLVENGYAKVAYLYDDYKYTSELITKQELASAKNIGVWNENAKKQYESGSKETTIDDEKYENSEIAIITIILLFMIFVWNYLRIKK